MGLERGLARAFEWYREQKGPSMRWWYSHSGRGMRSYAHLLQGFKEGCASKIGGGAVLRKLPGEGLQVRVRAAVASAVKKTLSFVKGVVVVGRRAPRIVVAIRDIECSVEMADVEEAVVSALGGARLEDVEMVGLRPAYGDTQVAVVRVPAARAVEVRKLFAVVCSYTGLTIPRSPEFIIPHLSHTQKALLLIFTTRP